MEFTEVVYVQLKQVFEYRLLLRCSSNNFGMCRQLLCASFHKSQAIEPRSAARRTKLERRERSFLRHAAFDPGVPTAYNIMCISNMSFRT